VQGLRGSLRDHVTGQEGRDVTAHTDELLEQGVPTPLAERAAAFLEEFALLDVAEIALREDEAPEDVVGLYFALSDRYAVDGVLTRITGLSRADRWQALARAALRYDLYAALEELTTVVVRTTAPGTAAERIQAWESANAATLDRARVTLDEVQRLPGRDLAPLSVALRTLRSVVKSGSADDAR
jgi:glutamate dehydrogenase